MPFIHNSGFDGVSITDFHLPAGQQASGSPSNCEGNFGRPGQFNISTTREAILSKVKTFPNGRQKIPQRRRLV